MLAMINAVVACRATGDERTRPIPTNGASDSGKSAIENDAQINIENDDEDNPVVICAPVPVALGASTGGRNMDLASDDCREKHQSFEARDSGPAGLCESFFSSEDLNANCAVKVDVKNDIDFDDFDDDDEEEHLFDASALPWEFQSQKSKQRLFESFNEKMRKGILPVLGEESVFSSASEETDFLNSGDPGLLLPTPIRSITCCTRIGGRNSEIASAGYEKNPTSASVEENLRQATKQMIDQTKSEPKNLIVNVTGTTAIVGDVHGDFLTVCVILHQLQLALDSGEIEQVVFLGDYIDRGTRSAATLNAVVCFYLKNPSKVTLLKGNHETVRQYTAQFVLKQGRCLNYSLADEEPQFMAMAKNEDGCPELLSEFFSVLPIGAVINKSTLAVHGGVPHTDRWQCISDMYQLKEKRLYAGYDVWAAIEGIIWSDYDPQAKINTPGERGIPGDYRIDSRYSDETAKVFLDYLNETHKDSELALKYLVRGHQCNFGTFYQFEPNPTVTTVFSALENQPPNVIEEGATVAFVCGQEPPTQWFVVDSNRNIFLVD